MSKTMTLGRATEFGSAWNSRDPDLVASFFADDGVYHASVGPDRLGCGIVGETPNLAARLQAVAEPGMVVIAESTRKQLGRLFDLEELEARDLKGIPKPVRSWAVLRTSAAESRFEASSRRYDDVRWTRGRNRAAQTLLAISKGW